MLNGGTSWLVGVGLVLFAPALRAAPIEIDGEVGAALFVNSAYRQSLRDFGQNGPIGGLQLTGRGLWRLGESARMGVRVGYLLSSAGSSDTLPDAPVGARSVGGVGFHLVDAGATFRWVPWRARSYETNGVRVAFDLEAGALVAVTVALRGQDAAVLPRFAAAALLGFAQAGAVRFGLRLGVQFIPSGGASGGAYWDPAFSGITFGLELGGDR